MLWRESTVIIRVSHDVGEDGVKPAYIMMIAGTALLDVGLGGKYSLADDLPVAQAEHHATIRYDTTIQATSDATVNTGMSAASSLKALQKTRDIGPYALAGRVRSDYDRVMGALRSRGYYAGRVHIAVKWDEKKIDGEDPELASFLSSIPQGQKINCQISAELGPQFRIGHLFFVSSPNDQTDSIVSAKRITLTDGERDTVKLHEGDPAIAADILGISGRLLTYLQEQGYAQANVSAPKAIVHPENQKVDIGFYLDRGPKVVIGSLNVNGLRRVKADYIYHRLTIREGQLYQPSVIEAARTDLGGTGLFSSVQVRNGKKIQSLSKGKSQVAGVDEAMPLDFDFTEGKRHRITADVGYSTDLGGRAGVSWLHRNLLGRGEQLRLGAMATGLGGTAQQGLGYDIYADFNKPDFMKRGRTLNLRVEALRQLLYSYHQTALLARGGVSQPLGKDWFVSGAMSIEQERILQFGSSRDYFIASLPLQVSFDNTHRSNPIEPATHGVRFAVGVTPSVSLENKTSFFLPMNAQVATYFDLHHLGISRPGQSIIAVRGMVGSIQGASTWNIPPDQRFYAGGPATVRGFRYQGVGPQYGNTKYAIGGTSMDAGTIEFRQRLPKNFGVVAFGDAGQVSSSSIPGHGKLRVGYGGGVRYFTPIGPVRVDVALPMNRPNRGDKWELYLGLGETF